MLNKRDRIIVYILIPILFILFLIGKIYKLILEFILAIKEGIENSKSII